MAYKFSYVFDRSYWRNRALATALGLRYSGRDHKRYEEELRCARGGLKCRSIKGAIHALQLDYPVPWRDARKCESTPAEALPEAELMLCRNDTQKRAQRRTEENKPTLQQFIKAFANAVSAEVFCEHAATLRLAKSYRSQATGLQLHGFECRQQWTISTKDGERKCVI